ncbi:hypothetical protein mRhiFer1_009074 [Rhinolophus ferrumequinum]|uniref:Uncharacterized protein n=1 Tax=Rhinolophus ferrumequinum TaxID=59479 RepID=A0A7J7SY75_RHIFE|nr:hypothetical protein mRhiFer1_009074 [Rhinolophus ferrumequinum]
MGKIRRGRAEASVDAWLDRSRPLRSWSTETNACPSCQETAAFKPAATSSSLSPFPPPSPIPHPEPRPLPPRGARRAAVTGRALGNEPQPSTLARGIGPRQAGDGPSPRMKTTNWLVGVEEAGTKMTEV